MEDASRRNDAPLPFHRENHKRLPVQKIEFLLQRIARLLHLAFDKLARRVVAQQAFEPGAAVEVDDRDAST